MQLLDALTRGLDIFYSSPVTHIDYHTGGVAVHTDNHTFKGAENSVAAWPCPFPANCMVLLFPSCRVGGDSLKPISTWTSIFRSTLELEWLMFRLHAAAAVLVTASLGVLKKGSITFQPPLPQRKLDVIERMGFGVLNKVRAGPQVSDCPAHFGTKQCVHGY